MRDSLKCNRSEAEKNKWCGAMGHAGFQRGAGAWPGVPLLEEKRFPWGTEWAEPPAQLSPPTWRGWSQTVSEPFIALLSRHKDRTGADRTPPAPGHPHTEVRDPASTAIPPLKLHPRGGGDHPLPAATRRHRGSRSDPAQTPSRTFPPPPRVGTPGARTRGEGDGGAEPAGPRQDRARTAPGARSRGAPVPVPPPPPLDGAGSPRPPPDPRAGTRPDQSVGTTKSRLLTKSDLPGLVRPPGAAGPAAAPAAPPAPPRDGGDTRGPAAHGGARPRGEHGLG